MNRYPTPAEQDAARAKIEERDAERRDRRNWWTAQVDSLAELTARYERAEHDYREYPAADDLASAIGDDLRQSTVIEVLADLADLDPDVWYAIAEQLTCTEANAIAALIDLTQGKPTGDMFRDQHAESDEEGDEHYAEPTADDLDPEVRAGLDALTNATADHEAEYRQHTVFLPCDRHSLIFAGESRQRQAELFTEGGPANAGPCTGDGCRLRPGRDLFVADLCHKGSEANARDFGWGQ
jgi:hypothetical protein